ncbi:MAG: hypothetical protein FJ317_05625 [SAR202 cluster bacterium]|nr:hypothetical protein [SAR202 cluster bacterium]
MGAAKRLAACLALIALLVAAGCQSPAAATRTPTEAAASPTPAPVATPSPTSTREPSPALTATSMPAPTPTGTAMPAGLDRLEVSIGGIVFHAEVAADPVDRALGLGGRSSLPERGGLLFVFESGVASGFWMKGMQFPLDFVWISVECRIIDIHENVPQPEPDVPDSSLLVYTPAGQAAFNLELGAGSIREYGLRVGMAVGFSGSQQQREYGCENR